MEAMKSPAGAGAVGAAMVNGGRVLRSQTAKTTSTLVDTKLTFKAKKTKNQEPAIKPNGKREGEPAESVIAEVVKKPKKTTTSTRKPKSSTSIGGVVQQVVASNGVVVAESWSVSLSAEGALAEATKHLVAADDKLKQIIESHGAGPVWEHKGSAFSALARAIVYQQLAGRAADVIYGRLITLCGGSEKMSPSVIASLSPEDLRSVGISGRKATYLHDLAEKFTSGFLSDEKLAVMSEDELVTSLTAVKGIGVWTAHMFMIFHLHKSDVLPVGDLGIRKGFQKLFQLKEQPSAVEMETLALSWRPYRTLASWYLWRLSDIKLPE